MSATIHRITAAGPILEPEQGVIERIEAILASARAGQVKGFGYFMVTGGDVVCHGYESGCADRHDMLAGASLLQHQVVSAASDE